MADVSKVSMEKFLTQYFMQRVFNAMSDEQFAQYQDIIKNNDFIGNMKDWKDKWHLVVEEPANSGKWVKNENDPDPKTNGLPETRADKAETDKAWEKLYKELRDAFRALSNNRKRLDDKDDKKTLDFLDAFYGFGLLFEPAQLTGDAATQFKEVFLPFIGNNKTNLYQALKDFGIYTDTEENFAKFIKDLKKGKHNTDNGVRDTLASIVGYLQSSYYGPAIKERMGIEDDIPDFEILQKGLEKDEVDPGKVIEFKKSYKLILDPIYREKNIYKNFEPHLDSVKDAIETAKKRIDYNNADSKDFLTEKRMDEKGPVEKTVDNVKKWWGDHTDKYVSLHKSRLFYSAEAQAIAAAIDKTKFKPTDGLDKFVESLKDIGAKVKGNKAKQHFKWFSETMVKLQGDKQMSSIFAGALKNPRKLKELAAEIAIQGIKDGKKDEEIQTAMEVLKTIQYGYATSNRLNAVMQQDLTLFSDKSLSWNKNEGMNFVMTGLDKTINFSLKFTALTLTTGYNIINRKIGNKFNGNISKRTQAAFAAHQQKRATEAATKEKEKQLLDKLDRENRRNAIAEKNATGITQRTLASEKRNLAALRTDEEAKKTVFDTAQADFNTAQQNFNIADVAFQNIKTTISAQVSRRKELIKINKELRTLQNKIDAIGTPTDPKAISALDRLKQQQNSLIARQNQVQQDINDATQEYNIALGNHTAAKQRHDLTQVAMQNAETAMQNAETAYNSVSTTANDLDSRITKFTQATERIKVAKERLTKRQTEFDKWQNEDKNRFAALMAHWDFLNSGRKRTGENVIQQALEGILPLSQKARQKRYDARKKNVHDAFLQRYYQQHADLVA